VTASKSISWIAIITMVAACLPLLGTHIIVKEAVNIIDEVSAVPHGYQANIYALHFDENASDQKHVVVLDAGHGGHDPGCLGAHSKEKDIALSIALRLGEALTTAHPEVEIIYTRKKDKFVPLHKRIAIANERKADVFISIHCNYVGNPNICGSETYVMGLHRAEENLNVAKRENAVVLMEEDFHSNYEGYDPNSPVGHILLSTIQNIHLDNSIMLAAEVETTLAARKRYKSRGVKQAGFVVLRQATMPSILVEAGFLSNAKEEQYLMSDTGQTDIANSLLTSLRSYLRLTEGSAADGQAETSTEPTSDIRQPYTIQLGVYSNPDNPKVLKQVLPLGKPNITAIGDVYRYTMGRYSSRSAAETALFSIHALGLTDAYIRQL